MFGIEKVNIDENICLADYWEMGKEVSAKSRIPKILYWSEGLMNEYFMYLGLLKRTHATYGRNNPYFHNLFNLIEYMGMAWIRNTLEGSIKRSKLGHLLPNFIRLASKYV